MSKKRSAVANSAQKGGVVEVALTNLTDISTPRVSFGVLARQIFKAPYTLSIAILPEKRAKVLNATYRDKTYSPNVLSFPLSKNEGEIILNLTEAQRQFDRGLVSGSWRAWVSLLVIHSMLHLNGMRHGRTMDEQVQKLLKKNNLRVTLLATQRNS